MLTIVKTDWGTWKAVIRKTGFPLTIKTLRLKRDAEDWARAIEDDDCSAGDPASGSLSSGREAAFMIRIRTTARAGLQMRCENFSPRRLDSSERSISRKTPGGALPQRECVSAVATRAVEAPCGRRRGPQSPGGNSMPFSKCRIDSSTSRLRTRCLRPPAVRSARIASKVRRS